MTANGDSSVKVESLYIGVYAPHNWHIYRCTGEFSWANKIDKIASGCLRTDNEHWKAKVFLLLRLLSFWRVREPVWAVSCVCLCFVCSYSFSNLYCATHLYTFGLPPPHPAHQQSIDLCTICAACRPWSSAQSAFKTSTVFAYGFARRIYGVAMRNGEKIGKTVGSLCWCRWADGVRRLKAPMCSSLAQIAYWIILYWKKPIQREISSSLFHLFFTFFFFVRSVVREWVAVWLGASES